MSCHPEKQKYRKIKMPIGSGSPKPFDNASVFFSLMVIILKYTLNTEHFTLQYESKKPPLDCALYEELLEKWPAFNQPALLPFPMIK